MTRPLCFHSVRRKLFPEDDVVYEAVKDNSSNQLREMFIAEKLRMKLQWNFDTENERQLDKDGPIGWVSAEGKYDFIGKVKIEENDEKKDTNEDMLNMKEQNEETPKGNKDDARVELLRKRKPDEDKNVADKVKRKLSFD